MSETNHSRQIKIGAVLSYLQMGLSLLLGIIYTPVMISKLGQSEYGLYNIAASTISMLSILSLGFGSGYLRFYAKYRAKGEKDSIYRLNGLFLLTFSIIGMVALIIGCFLSFHLELVYDNGLTAGEYTIARVLMLLLTVNLALSFPMSVFNTIISANEQFIFQKVINMGKTVLTPLLTIPLLFAGFKSIAVVAVTVLLTFVVDVFNILYVVKKLKNKFYFRNFEKGIFKQIFVYTTFIMINTIVGQINWNVDKVLLGRFQGTAAVAVYAVASTLHVSYENFSTCVSNVFRTKVHMLVNTTNENRAEQRLQLTNLFVRVGRIQFLILGLVLSGFIFFGKQFITCFWAGPEYEESYYIAVLLLVSVSIVLIQNIGIDIQRAMDKHRFRSIAYLFMSVVNLLLTVWLCQIYGAIGAAIGTAMSVIVVDGLIINVFYHKQCNVNVLEFWRNILRMSVGLIPPVLFGIVAQRFLDLGKIVPFIGGIVLYTFIYAVSVWNVSMNEEEKLLFKNFLVKKRK